MYWFLFFSGVAVGLFAKYLWDVKNTRGITFVWWVYLIIAGLAAWIGMGAIFVFTSIQEYEPRAAAVAAILFGLVGIFGLVVLRWIHLRQTVSLRNIDQAEEVGV